MRIAINGMGRIGRLLFRRLIHDPEFELVAVNDTMHTANLQYLLKYDTIYGSFRYDKPVIFLQQADPAAINWAEMNIDVVLECSGKFSTQEGAAKHLQAGANKVLLSTTGSFDIPLLIYGHNHQQLTAVNKIISPGGCMTNCATHILYILNSIGIESAQINVLHSYTSRQELVDTHHAQFRRGRAGAESIIPIEVDLAQSLERLLPFQHKIATMSTRVPVANGAMADFTVQLKEEVTAAGINELFRKSAALEYKGILEYTEDPLVSADIKGNIHSAIIDGTLTSVAGKQVKIIAWFDNEYGFTSRMMDWLHYLK